jgi:hypothetical protein
VHSDFADEDNLALQLEPILLAELLQEASNEVATAVLGLPDHHRGVGALVVKVEQCFGADNIILETLELKLVFPALQFLLPDYFQSMH